LRASRTIDRRSPRMVKRRNSRYKAFQWGAARRLPIDCTPQPAPPMLHAPPGRTRLRRAWATRNPKGRFVCVFQPIVDGRFSRTWTAFQADRGRRFSLIVDDCGARE
jgi:hypothetical protein